MIEKYSPTWVFIEKWANEQLQLARESNDSSIKDIVQTSIIRGKIKMLKELIDLPGKPPKEVKK